MSKSAKIGMVLADGRIKAISLSWAGCPSKAGATLEAWYKTQADIKALLALGNLFQLGTRPEPARNQMEEETTVAYVRDWGFAGCDAVIFADKEDFEKKGESAILCRLPVSVREWEMVCKGNRHQQLD